MTNRDKYYNRSKQEGYRTRAAYKLKQLDDAVGVIEPGDTVVDLGAAPGGWLQVARELAGEAGTVLGVDRRRIEPIEGVETLRGDLTEASTREAIVERVGRADVVLSDMAPEMTGEYELDHARSVHLARQAFEVALEVLDGGGTFVTKVFEGPDLDGFRGTVAAEFARVNATRPDATREASSELYLVATGRLTAPVRAGERLALEVEATGEEGDGIAYVEGFTVFVPDADPGETVDVEIEDVKPRFAFAERLDREDA